MLDLCYEEDSHAQVDLNCVMTGAGELVELQGTGEGRPFTIVEQRALVELCAKASGSSRTFRDKCWGAKCMKLVLASKNAISWWR